jgi:diaminohydroxyphosphoribosylaminopyrimidine deaminase/5-amino-6-(5-phosphoribosylamino)uracil reductase
MSDTARDIELSRRALELASAGIGLVSPNPLVGCVITNSDGTTVGEGTYIHDNVTHAEVIALRQAGEKARGGTAYVSLEPHDHQSKTPPCTEALINAGIKRVVCPIEDPNPLVSGRGFARLKASGVEVVTGILADEAAKQNEKFICWHKKGRPFVHLKMAMSLDGRISLGANAEGRMSGDVALKRVHELRHEYDAILVGPNTVVIDNPSLTDRSGLPRRRPLVRVVLDNSKKTPLDVTVVTTARETPTIVFTNSTDDKWIIPLRESGVDVVQSEFGGRELSMVLNELKRRDIQSVMAEGGSEIAASFIHSGLVDKVTFIYSPMIVGGKDALVAVGGTSTEPPLRLRDIEITRLGNDIEVTGYPDGKS